MNTTLNTITDEELAARYLDPGAPIYAIANQLGCTLEALMSRLESASFRNFIERLKRITLERARTIAALAVQPAISTLASLLTDRDARPETRRKAARELTIAATAPTTRAHAPATTPDAETRSKPTPRPTPPPPTARTTPPPMPRKKTQPKPPAARLIAAAGAAA